MRVRYLFGSRHTKNLENIRKQREKYPALLLKVIETSDVVLEVLDARFIDETRNKEVEKLIESLDKRLIFVLNKSDLIDKNNVSKESLKEIRPYVFVSTKKREGSRDLRDRIKSEAKKARSLSEKKFDRIQVGVVGQPNSGKSSVINFLIGKSSAKTGAQAGFTKGIQKLKLTSEILLLDSPGVIPKGNYSSDKMEAIALDAKIGARSPNKLKEPEIVIAKLFNQYSKVLKKFYKIENKELNDSEEFLELVGRKMNFLKKGGFVDEDKTSRKIIHDWQSGKIKI